MSNEYTFDMEELLSYEWTLTCQAESAEEACRMAEEVMRGDVEQWARRCNPPQPPKIISQRIRGPLKPANPAPAQLNNKRGRMTMVSISELESLYAYSSHPILTREDWQAEVAEGATSFGYIEWLAGKLNEEEESEQLNAPTHDQFRNVAKQLYGSDEIVIHDDAEIDASPDDGAWVTARVWVPNAEARAQQPQALEGNQC